MSDMQRYTVDRDDLLEHVPVSMYPNLREVVLASDAEAAIAAAEQRGMRQAHDSVPALQQYGIEKYHEGQRDAIAAAVQRVEALLPNGPRSIAAVVHAIKGDDDE